MQLTILSWACICEKFWVKVGECALDICRTICHTYCPDDGADTALNITRNTIFPRRNTIFPGQCFPFNIWYCTRRQSEEIWYWGPPSHKDQFGCFSISQTKVFPITFSLSLKTHWNLSWFLCVINSLPSDGRRWIMKREALNFVKSALEPAPHNGEGKKSN